MRVAGNSMFLFLYLIALLKPIQPLIEYYLRYDYFAKELCLNLDRPEMKCNGKCILMQRLKNAAEESAPTPLTPTSSNVNIKEYPIGLMFLVSVPEDTFTYLKTLTGYIFHIAKPVARDIFRPPS